jgi:hypothetical protein
MVSLSDAKSMWDTYGFEIVLGVCVIFLVLYALYRKVTRQKGTWSNMYSLPVKESRKGSSESPRQPPTESKGEAECRRVLQYYFKRPFNNSRPDFLRNPVTGGNFNLELDCFDSEMGLAVEYSGKQHFSYIPYFHRTKDAFTNQKYRDYMKANMCRENKVTLIVVPYTVKVEDIKGFLEKELRRLGYLSDK